MYLGYNTNGMAHHRLTDAVAVLAGLGYQGVAITIDHHALAPDDLDLPHRLEQLRRLLERCGMQSVIETGARFLLDPWHKHQPTLLSEDPEGRTRRITFYKHAIRVAAALGSQCVSLWSGSPLEPLSPKLAMQRLAAGLRELLEEAERYGVVLGFEPEPGMFIDSLAAFGELLDQVDAPGLRLTLDVGHVYCNGEGPIADIIRRWAHRLVNVHLEDMRAGVHEHLIFGEGEVDVGTVFSVLAEVGYSGGIYVELNRHSHEAPVAAGRAITLLRPLLDRALGMQSRSLPGKRLPPARRTDP